MDYWHQECKSKKHKMETKEPCCYCDHGSRLFSCSFCCDSICKGCTFLPSCLHFDFRGSFYKMHIRYCRNVPDDEIDWIEYIRSHWWRLCPRCNRKLKEKFT